MLSSSLPKYGKWIFLLLIFVQLFSVWQYDYFLTADGPAHVANAKILLDLLRGNHTDFYAKYYEQHFSFFPNWTSHLALAGLMVFFNPITAEKILVSGYVILFALSFRMVVYRLSGRESLMSSIGVLFVFHFLVYYGFYNYSISIALALLFVAVWKACSEKPVWKQWAVLLPLAFVMTLTHLFSWFLSALILGSYFVISILLKHLKDSPATFMSHLIKQWLTVFLIGVSAVVFCYVYMHQNAGEMQYFEEDIARQWENFSSLKMLVLWDAPYEGPLIQSVAFAILALSALQIYFRIKRREHLLHGDAWLLVAIVIVSLYFIQPKFLCLGGFWSPRMSWLGWLAFAAWVSGYTYGKKTEAATAIFTLLILLSLKYSRLPYEQKSNEALHDYLSAAEYIPEKATVLALSFSHLGTDRNGKIINTWRKQFLHAFDYCGAEKPIINFANYEAVTTWFPLKWKATCNPASYINKGNGIEAQPPDAHLSFPVTESCNAQPDYVITWCMNFVDSTTAEWISIDGQLHENFELSYLSATHRTAVWKRRQ